MARPKHRDFGKGKGKHRKGPVKGAKDVGLGERSKPKFKRNPHKAKVKWKRGKAAGEAKGKAGRFTKGRRDQKPKAEQDVETEVVKVGEKRKDSSKKQHGAKRPKVESQKKPEKKAPPNRKERRELKRKKRKNFDLISKSIHLWERLRKHDLQKSERSQILEEAMQLITGHIHEFALKHDTARIIQCCLKYGTPQHHTAIFTELKDHVVELSKSTYAKFTVKRMMRLCTPEQRDHLISGLYGHVRKLVCHREAADVVEYAYNNHATATQRSALLQEFYGPKFALFKSKEVLTLEDVLSANPQQRESVMSHMQESLTKLLDKSVVKHSIVHKALLDYLLHCDEASRTDMIELLREVVVEILHTKDGSRVALQCLWHGTAKDRKVIVKSFKPYVKKICMEEYGHVVMLGVFDAVDDTVLVKKTLLSELVPCLEELCDHRYGCRVILYLLSPRNKQHFSSQFVESVLACGDGNKHTKKSHEVRHRELLDSVAPHLLQVVGKKAGEWAVSKPLAPLLLQVAASLPGNITPLYKPLLDLLQVPFDPNSHIVTHPCGHWVIKKLLTCEHEKEEEGKEEEEEEGEKEEKEEGNEEEEGKEEEEMEEASGSGEEAEGTGKDKKKRRDLSFAEMILDRIEPDDIQTWTTTNRGSFVVCSLLKSKVCGVREKVKAILQPVSSSLRTGSLQGQQVLWQELSRDN